MTHRVIAQAPLATVLIVDDEDAVRLILARLLAHLGYASVLAADGPSAIELVAHRTVDCVLLDVAPPDAQGVETARSLLAAAPDLRLVLMSNQAALRVAAQTADVPAVGYLQKPFSYEELRRTLSAATLRAA